MPVTEPAAPTPALPLFPLQTVLYPGMRLLLKVFEARYLDLVRELGIEDGHLISYPGSPRLALA